MTGAETINLVVGGLVAFAALLITVAGVGWKLNGAIGGVRTDVAKLNVKVGLLWDVYVIERLKRPGESGNPRNPRLDEESEDADMPLAGQLEERIRQIVRSTPSIEPAEFPLLALRKLFDTNPELIQQLVRTDPSVSPQEVIGRIRDLAIRVLEEETQSAPG